MERIAFIPWTAIQGKEFVEEYVQMHKERKKTHHKDTWTIVTEDTKNQPLARLGKGHRRAIHVVGHGNVGSRTISLDENDDKDSVHVRYVAHLLKNLGLHPDFAGDIYCDVCYGGVGTGSECCFAQALAVELDRLGYYKLTVVGYLGTLYNQFTEWKVSKLENQKKKKKKFKYTHRVVSVEEYDPYKVKKYYKAKEKEIRFKGNQKHPDYSDDFGDEEEIPNGMDKWVNDPMPKGNPNLKNLKNGLPPKIKKKNPHLQFSQGLPKPNVLPKVNGW